MARTRRTEVTIESNLKPERFMRWQNCTYRIVSRNLVFIEVEDVATSGTTTTLRIDELYLPESRGGSPPVFASTLEKLRAEIDILYPTPKPTAKTTLPQWALSRAETVQAKVKQIERKMDEIARKELKEGNALAPTDLLNAACRELQFGRSTYYKYVELMRTYSGNQDAIAASFLRAGVPILDALAVVGEENASKKMQEVLADMQRFREDVLAKV